jgi:hypothetical protein
MYSLDGNKNPKIFVPSLPVESKADTVSSPPNVLNGRLYRPFVRSLVATVYVFTSREQFRKIILAVNGTADTI